MTTLRTTHDLRRRLGLAAAAAAGLLALSACVSGPGSAPAPTSTGAPAGQDLAAVRPAPPQGRVIATGTVIDVGGAVQLCLGAVAQSAPPQCSGIPLDAWTWDGVDGAETIGDTTWGAYAVTGTYDGDRFTTTDAPIMLALYDTVAPEDPTGGVDGTSDAAELTRVQEELASSLGAEALTVSTERGYVWVQVAWDDGTIQDAVDAAYGDDVVVVTSAMRLVG